MNIHICTDDTTLITESEEELKSLLMEATQLREGSQRAAALRHPALARPVATMPKRKVSSAEGMRRRSPRGGRRGCQQNRLLQKWKRSQKRRRERINLQTKKCKQKGKEEQRENRRKWPTRRLKKTDLQKMERRKTRRAQPLMKQKRKKPSLINNHTPSPVSGPCFPSCTIQRNIFINYFVNASFLVALETFLKRRVTIERCYSCTPSRREEQDLAGGRQWGEIRRPMELVAMACLLCHWAEG